ncbi:MAG: hypothetical protein WDA02_11105 [Saccharofermentanales bacterium]
MAGVMPGTTVAKVVTVENTGNNPVWVRVKLTPALAPDVADWDSLITVTTNSTDWILDGGYYYYNTQLAAGATTTAVVSAVAFDQTMGNAYQNAQFSLNVTAQAVQSENNGASALAAAGW